jgi:nicotinamidase-related amidase
MLMAAERSMLVVVDAQERLLPAMAAPETVIRSLSILLKAAAAVDVPVLASEQYPRGLGPTVPEIATLLPEGNAPVAKTAFGCLDEPVFAGRFAAIGRPQVVLTGVEAHVCVLQTAAQLRAKGCEVFVVADAVSSRVPLSAERALARMAAWGVEVVTAEMVAFEWVRAAGTPAFKTVSGLVK